MDAQRSDTYGSKDIQTYPAALTVAGSDSGGGAGIQADLRTFSAFGVYGTSAITAVTAQNPCEVRKVIPLSPDALSAQIEAVSAKFAIKAIKTGMLHNAELIHVCATFLEKLEVPLVVDPVMVSSSGALLLEDDAIDAVREELLPLCDWMTPNAAEAGRLLGTKISCHDDMVAAAKECSRRWKASCIVKGGDIADHDDKAVDVVASRGGIYTLSTPRLGNP
ncbi:MAG: bifunctional hydroxymethylpyrimidine kinase/phosphomethylpyrimidine kinase, partial [Victivallales bacterium]|nr:bifunctional hydroxymethylpyrimidine kinase/phosphomethylpyrimidine kinase [Victivallales bacterium]